MGKRVVIAGAGFGGLRVAKLLDRWLKPGEAEVVLVDRTPYHTLRPKIPQSIGGRIPCAVRIPVTAALSGTAVRFAVHEIARIDPQARRIEWDGGAVSGDVLVLALGAEVEVPERLLEAPDAALPVWSFDQACAVRRRVQLLTAAAHRGRPVDVSVLVVGGGFVGVEVAAELQGRLARSGGPAWRGKVTLLEREPRILPRLSPWASRAAARHLQRIGVRVVTGAEVSRVGAGHVRLADGQAFEAGTVIWAAGRIRAPRVLAEAGMTDATRRVPVMRTLESAAFPGVFALGDSAYVVDDDPRLAEPSAHRAELQALTVARNVLAQLRGRPLVCHRPTRNVYLLGLGPGFGLLDAGPGLRLHGHLPALLKEAILVRYLWGLGGWPLVRRALGPVVVDSLVRARWEREPLPDGAV